MPPARQSEYHSGPIITADHPGSLEQLPHRLFIEEGAPDFVSVYLTDDEYSKALQRFILLCVDSAIFERSEDDGSLVLDDEGYPVVWLAMRSVRPARNVWWVIGGARRPGHSPLEDLELNWLRETRTMVGMERFVVLSTHEYIWKDRSQEPIELGCHIRADTYGIALTGPEIRRVASRLEAREYYVNQGLVRFTYRDICGPGHHPMLQVLVEAAKQHAVDLVAG